MITLKQEVDIDVDVYLEDIIDNISGFSTHDLLTLKTAIDESINNINSKSYDVSSASVLKYSDQTMDNVDKINYLVDNIWNINLKDLENIRR